MTDAIATLHGESKTQTATLIYQLDRHTLRVARRREGRYLLRANLTDTDPVKMWEYYLQLTLPEQAPPKIQAPVPTSNCENPVVPIF